MAWRLSLPGHRFYVASRRKLCISEQRINAFEVAGDSQLLSRSSDLSTGVFKCSKTFALMGWSCLSQDCLLGLLCSSFCLNNSQLHGKVWHHPKPKVQPCSDSLHAADGSRFSMLVRLPQLARHSLVPGRKSSNTTAWAYRRWDLPPAPAQVPVGWLAD